MQIKIIKEYKQYRKGELVEIPARKGLKLIKSGFAIAHKMMVTQ